MRIPPPASPSRQCEERHIDPARMTAGLAGLARKSGTKIREKAEVTRLRCAARLVRAVCVGEGSLPVDSVVLAGGASSGALLRPLGVRLPLTAGKGYSFLHRLRVLPRRPIHLGDIKVAIPPFARGLRVAGTMELSGNNDTFHQSRADAIARVTAQYFSGWDELDGDGNDRKPAELWVGRRPLTPDGLPILDRVHPFENLYLATGHSMLGITLAPASGMALSDYVMSGKRRNVRQAPRTTGTLPPRPLRRPPVAPSDFIARSSPNKPTDRLADEPESYASRTGLLATVQPGHDRPVAVSTSALAEEALSTVR
jgi:glycine/D-amino acid oxidase-like deaminating enzyme